MQLSLVAELPEFDKRIFLDIFAQTYFDSRRGKVRLKTIGGQPIPADIQVGCVEKLLMLFPEGTIYKLDARLVNRLGKKPYFLVVSQKKVERAIEFFEHNLRLQKGLLDCNPKQKKVVRTPRKKKFEEFAPF